MLPPETPAGAEQLANQIPQPNRPLSTADNLTVQEEAALSPSAHNKYLARQHTDDLRRQIGDLKAEIAEWKAKWNQVNDENRVLLPRVAKLEQAANSTTPANVAYTGATVAGGALIGFAGFVNDSAANTGLLVGGGILLVLGIAIHWTSAVTGRPK